MAAKVQGAIPLPNEGGSPLIDNHGRVITYIRLAITDRCNLRCVYCMPAEGIDFSPREEILSLDELERLVQIFVNMGVNKVRITGGEPFVRKGLMAFLKRLKKIPGLATLGLTTNGVAVAPELGKLKELGIADLNVSLDTLRSERFQAITRRDQMPAVLETIHQAMALGMSVKVNSVIQEGINDDEIIDLTELARNQSLEIRFIEQMPFSGSCAGVGSGWKAAAIIAHLQEHYPDMILTDGVSGTAKIIKIPGFSGRVGIIGAYSRTFCGSCGKLRITSRGLLKTCLYDDGVLDLRGLLRSEAADEVIQLALRNCVARRAKNGFEAEANEGSAVKTSMATIGG